MTSGVKTEPTTAAEVVDLIRRQVNGGRHSIDRAAAISLVELYASVVASEASIKATSESYGRCIAVTDMALSMPLASLPSADHRSV